MCLVCDAKKLSGDPRKELREINRELIGIIETAVNKLSDVLLMVANAHDEKRPMNSAEMAVCDEAAALVVRNDNSEVGIAELIAAMLGKSPEGLTVVVLKPADDDTPPEGATKH